MMKKSNKPEETEWEIIKRRRLEEPLPTKIYRYFDGEFVRECSEEEAELYIEMITSSEPPSGVVDGHEFDLGFSIYME